MTFKFDRHYHFVRAGMMGLLTALFLATSSFGLAENASPVRIWSATIFSVNKPQSDMKPVPDEMVPQLEEIFGYRYYYLLGETEAELTDKYHEWVVPSGEFFFKIDHRGGSRQKGVHLDIQLWHKKEVVVKTSVLLKDEPLYIRGPQWGYGEIELALSQH